MYEKLLNKVEFKIGMVLGINCNEKRGGFIMNVNRSINKSVNLNPTKRNVLKPISGIYDPHFKYETFKENGITCFHMKQISELILPLLLFDQLRPILVILGNLFSFRYIYRTGYNKDPCFYFLTFLFL